MNSIYSMHGHLIIGSPMCDVNVHDKWYYHHHLGAYTLNTVETVKHCCTQTLELIRNSGRPPANLHNSTFHHVSDTPHTYTYNIDLVARQTHINGFIDRINITI